MFWIQMSEQHPLKYRNTYEPSVTFGQTSMNDREGGMLSAQGGAGLTQRLGRHIGTSA